MTLDDCLICNKLSKCYADCRASFGHMKDLARAAQEASDHKRESTLMETARMLDTEADELGVALMDHKTMMHSGRHAVGVFTHSVARP